MKLSKKTSGEEKKRKAAEEKQTSLALANKLANLKKERAIQKLINDMKMDSLSAEERESIEAQKKLEIQQKQLEVAEKYYNQLLKNKNLTEEEALNYENELYNIEEIKQGLIEKRRQEIEKNKENKENANEQLTEEQKKTKLLNAFKLKTDKQVHAQREQLQVQHFETIMEAMRKHSKTSFGIFKALRLAQATISGLQAVVEAYRFGTQIGGVATGAIFAATASAATALQISQIAAMQFEEKRFGGAMKGGRGGNFYEFVEQGNPELFSVGSRNFLGMPSGMSGMVKPLNNLSKVNLGGGSKSVKIEIINEAPNVQVEEESRDETPEGQKITLRIQEIVAQSIIDGNNSIASALQTTYPLQRQGAL